MGPSKAQSTEEVIKDGGVFPFPAHPMGFPHVLRKEGSLTRTRDSQALQWLGQVSTSALLH